MWWLLSAMLIVSLVALMIGYAVWMPGEPFRGPAPPLDRDQQATRSHIERHVSVLAGDIGERNLRRYGALNTAREYIRDTFIEFGYAPLEERITVSGRPVFNVIVTRRGSVYPQRIIVIGAHYDTVPHSPGANDNGSGVAALLELARLQNDQTGALTLRFVAFVNEEEPYFGTPAMGSLYHARKTVMDGDEVVAMLSLETIGYYSDEPNSQAYPFPFRLFYPRTGNFIGFVGNLGSRSLVRRALRVFRSNATIASEGVAAPEIVGDIGRSDHWSFWQLGVPAIMVTDTANFRYSDYHQPTDTPDIIDYDRLTRVVHGLIETVRALTTPPD